MFLLLFLLSASLTPSFCQQPGGLLCICCASCCLHCQHGRFGFCQRQSNSVDKGIPTRFKKAFSSCQSTLPFFFSPFWALLCTFLSEWSTLGDMWLFLSGGGLFPFWEEFSRRCFSKVWPLQDLDLAASTSSKPCLPSVDGCGLDLLSCFNAFSALFSSAFLSSVEGLDEFLVGEEWCTLLGDWARNLDVNLWQTNKQKKYSNVKNKTLQYKMKKKSSQHRLEKKQWSGFRCPAEAALHRHSYLEVEGDAKCLVILAGESDLLTGEPQPGDSVLLSLRRRSFWKFSWLKA